jgi:hypothetical protein
MAPNPPFAASSRLDPLGTVIYYLCVCIAVTDGDMRIPSGQTISKMLGTPTGKGTGRKAVRHIDGRTLQIWLDMLWLHKEKLVFDEKAVDESEYWVTLTSTNVNKRINAFRPGFKYVSPKVRIIDPKVLVEKTITAARLVAWKDLYHSNHREVPQKLLFRFLRHRELIKDDSDFVRFLETMEHIKYLDMDVPDAEKTQVDLHKDFLVEPGQVLRDQDMYIELRALDYLSEQGADHTDRTSLRKQMLREAQASAAKGVRSKNVEAGS